MLEISFEASQTFGLTAFQFSQTRSQLAGPETDFLSLLTLIAITKNQPSPEIKHQTICSDKIQTVVISASHCLTDWLYLEHP